MIKLASWTLALGIVFAYLTAGSITSVFLLLRALVWVLMAVNAYLLTSSHKLGLGLFCFGLGEVVFDANEHARNVVSHKVIRSRSLYGRLVKVDPCQNGSSLLLFRLENGSLGSFFVSGRSWCKNLSINSDYRFGLFDPFQAKGPMNWRDGKLFSGRIGWLAMIKYRPLGVADQLLEFSRQRLSKKAHILYSTVFLGYKCQDTEFLEVKEPFVRVGLVHFMARSGLHVLMITDFVGRILRLLFIPWPVAWLLQLLFLLLYSLFSWPSVSFSRAVLMIILSMFASATGRNLAFDNIFYLVLFLTILLNPYQLFCLDFQLSFALTMALLMAFN